MPLGASQSCEGQGSEGRVLVNDFVDFMFSDSWQDYRQGRRIRDLEDHISSVNHSLSSARASQRRLHSELSKVRGSLEQRLDRLSAAFDAFVEISDVRMTLGLFDAPARVRHQARQLFAAAGPDGEVSDVDGYWLAPALMALRVAMDGVVDPEAMALARARDGRRAAVFHVLGTGLLGGRSTVTAGSLAEVLRVPGATLSRDQRAMWTLAADGYFGAAGRNLVRRRGAEFVGSLSGEQREAAAERLRTVATADAAVVAPPGELEDLKETGVALTAAAGLAAMRTWVETAVAGGSAEPGEEVDPEVRRAVALLVDEGSAPEVPLLARERELRAVIEGTGAEVSTWDGPAGETVELLEKDAGDAEHPGRRAVAVLAGGDLVVAAAQKLAATARADAPYRVRARTRLGLVTITADGPEEESAARLRSMADEVGRVSASRRAGAVVSAAVAAAFVVLAFVAGWGWVLVALAAAALAVQQWYTDAGLRRDAAANAEAVREKLAREIDGRVTVLTEYRARLAADQSKIEQNLKAIREALV
jgi:hypothetical protein